MRLLRFPETKTARARAALAVANGGRSASAPLSRSVLRSMPRSVRELYGQLRALPSLGDDDVLAATDHFAAQLASVLARFSDAPQALLPAQRGLLLMGGAPKAAEDAIPELMRALLSVDAALDDDTAGFSRLLESALSEGEVEASPRLDVTLLEPDLVPLGEALEETALILEVVDDLSHALQTSATAPAGAALAATLAELIAGDDDADAFGARWLAHRGASDPVQRLFAFRPALFDLTSSLVDAALERGLGRALATWTMAVRLSADGHVHTEDREALDRLLIGSRLAPLAAFADAGVIDLR